jgi:hypothetical protein
MKRITEYVVVRVVALVIAIFTMTTMVFVIIAVLQGVAHYRASCLQMTVDNTGRCQR